MLQFQFLKLRHLAWSVASQEEGQDLVEYALIVALIALAATAGMGSLATALSGAFSSVGSKVTDYVS